MKLCGINACLAACTHRRDDIIRVYLTKARLKQFGDVLSWCASTRRAYHVVANEELDKITQSTHHEGVCLLVRLREPLSLPRLCARLGGQTGPACVLLLEGVANPHNLGAVLRVAAHFGVSAVVHSDTANAALELSTALCRTAEGAAESVPMVRVPDAVRAVQALRRCSLEILGTSSHSEHSLYAGRMPSRCVVLLGSESGGLSEALAAEADRIVAVPGTGLVESLNVACAAAVVLGEFRRQHPWQSR